MADSWLGMMGCGLSCRGGGGGRGMGREWLWRLCRARLRLGRFFAWFRAG